MCIIAVCLPPSLLLPVSRLFATRFQLNPIPLHPSSAYSSHARSQDVLRLQPVFFPMFWGLCLVVNILILSFSCAPYILRTEPPVLPLYKHLEI
jgi:hypothetical protein